LASLRFEIATRRARIARLERARQSRVAQVGARARELYILGPGARLDALMASRSVEEFEQRASTIDLIARFDRGVMEDLDRVVHAEDVETRSVRAEEHQAAAVRQEIGQRASTLAGALARRQQAEGALKGRINAFLDEVRALQAEQAQILALIRSKGSFGVGPVSIRGLIWPTSSHHINSPYGPRYGGFHTGVDIECPEGHPDWAAKAGTVIAARWGGGYGNMVIIDHGGGISTLYAHHSRILVHEGEHVARGQQIAECGATGHATGPHLHFEVRVNGNPVNPMPYLP
jgi:murein DD-endopeptidase MepM/ murein hydrolase activator NlpD